MEDISSGLGTLHGNSLNITLGVSTVETSNFDTALETNQAVGKITVTVTCLVTLIGVLVQSLALHVLRTCPHLWSSNSYLIGNLGVAEGLLQIFSLPNIFGYAYKSPWLQYSKYVIPIGIPMEMTMMVSMVTMAAIMWDRYCFITHALHYIPKRSRDLSTRLIFAFWFVCALLPFTRIPCGLKSCSFFSVHSQCLDRWCLIGHMPFLIIFVVTSAIIILCQTSLLKTSYRHIDHDRLEACNRIRLSRTEHIIATIGQDMILNGKSYVQQQATLDTISEDGSKEGESPGVDGIVTEEDPAIVNLNFGINEGASTSYDIPQDHYHFSANSTVHVHVDSPNTEYNQSTYDEPTTQEAANPVNNGRHTFKKSRPLELYLGVSCDMSSGLSESVSSLSIDNSSSREGFITPNLSEVPRIEIISPTTNGRGSQIDSLNSLGQPVENLHHRQPTSRLTCVDQDSNDNEDQTLMVSADSTIANFSSLDKAENKDTKSPVETNLKVSTKDKKAKNKKNSSRNSQDLVNAWLDHQTMDAQEIEPPTSPNLHRKGMQLNNSTVQVLDPGSTSRNTSLCSDRIIKMSLVDFLIDDQSEDQADLDIQLNSRRNSSIQSRARKLTLAPCPDLPVQGNEESPPEPQDQQAKFKNTATQATKRKALSALRACSLMSLYLMRWVPLQVIMLWPLVSIPESPSTFYDLIQIFLAFSLLAGILLFCFCVYTHKQFKFAIKDVINNRGNRIAPHLLHNDIEAIRASIIARGTASLPASLSSRNERCSETHARRTLSLQGT